MPLRRTPLLPPGWGLGRPSCSGIGASSVVRAAVSSAGMLLAGGRRSAALQIAFCSAGNFLATKAPQRRRSLAQGAKGLLGYFRARTGEAVDPEGRGGVHRLWMGLAQVLLPRRIAGARLQPAGLAFAVVSGRCRSSHSNPVDVSNSSPCSATTPPSFTRPRQ